MRDVIENSAFFEVLQQRLVQTGFKVFVTEIGPQPAPPEFDTEFSNEIGRAIS